MPITDYTQQNNLDDIPLTGNLLGSTVASDDLNISQKLIKRFVTTEQKLTGGSNGLTSLEDPTYLGFNIRFDITSPLFNGAITGPTIASNRPSDLTENINGQIANGIPAGDLSSPHSYKNEKSAVSYLERIGEKTRATYLRAFVQGLLEINNNRPYYWQSIEGLSEAWEKSVNLNEPYSGAADDEGIVISTLESIDLKIAALFNLYKSAVFDLKYKRHVVTSNLLKFTTYVDVLEIRKFKSIANWMRSNNQSLESRKITEFVNNNTSVITFKFEKCKWNINAANTLFENVTNAGSSDPAANSIKFRYDRVSLEAQFAGYNSSLSDDNILQTKIQNNKIDEAAKKIDKSRSSVTEDPLVEAQKRRLRLLDLGNELLGIGKNGWPNANDIKQEIAGEFERRTGLEKIKDLGPNLFGKVEDRFRFATNQIAQGAVARIQNKLLGNVYGERNTFFRNLSNPQLINNLINGARIQEDEVNSITQNNIGENAYAGQTNEVSSSIQSNNIYGVTPSGPAPLNVTNVYE